VTAGRYLEGVVLGLLCVGALGLGACRLRSRVAPFYVGIVARIADSVTFIGLLILTLETVGVIGVLDRVGVLAGCLTVGAGAWIIGSRGRGGPTTAASPAVVDAARTSQDAGPHRRIVTALAIAALSVAAAAWLGWTIYAYRDGMATIDTLWYHLPFAARFVQLHNIRHLQYVDDGAITVFYPANSELVHAFGMILFGNDLVSPLIDLGWAVLAGCSAWAVGRPWRREPHCLLGLLVVLATPAMVDTQPGGAYDDIVCLALVLAMVALVVNAPSDVRGPGLPLGASLLAAVAGGLALGTKYTAVVAAIAFGLGTTVALGRGRRRRHAAIWAAGMALLGGYWYLRDGIAVGNPLPSLSHLGPLTLPSPHITPTYTVWQYLDERHIWTAVFIPGLRQTLGLAWWALLLGSMVGALAALRRLGEPRIVLIGGLAVLLGFVYLITPELLGLPGAPIFFVDNVRYLMDPLALGLVMFGLLPVLERPRATLAWAAAVALGLLFTVLDPGVWRSGFPVKPFATTLHGGPALAGALLGAAGLAAGQLWLWRGPPPGAVPRLLAALRRPAIGAMALTGATVVVAAAGWVVGNAYAHDRYRDSPPAPAIYAWAQRVHQARIGVVGLVEQYPLTGADLTNHVQFIGVGEPHRGFAAAADCRQWRTAINRGHYNYVLIAPPGFAGIHQAPEVPWTVPSPAARPIVRQYVHSVEYAVVYRITGRLDPAQCPSG
jgi:hypothetical protein